MFCQYVLLFLAATSVARVTCPPPPGFILHADSTFVLDGQGHQVKIQHKSKMLTQYWTKEFAGNGKHFIKNVATGKVLDIEGDATSNANVITADKDGSEKQQWYVNSDDSIVSVANDKLALDIKDNVIKPGTKIIVYRKHGYSNQKLLF